MQHHEKNRTSQWAVLYIDGRSLFAPPTYLDPTPSWKPPSKWTSPENHHHINKVNGYDGNLKAKHDLHILIHDTSELPTSFIQNKLLLHLSSNNKKHIDKQW